MLAALVAAASTAVGLSAPTRAAVGARTSPTPANVYLHTKLGKYAVTVTATTGRKTATLVVYLSRGNPSSDEQTHTYAFTLARRAVAIDSKLGRARIRARLGSFGAIALTLSGRGKSSVAKPPAGCSGPATISRPARARGKLKIKLPGLGTIRGAGRSVGLDRLQRRGTLRCPKPRCDPIAGVAIAGINDGGKYLSIQSDPGRGTRVFGTVAERLKRPRVSVNHTRFARGGSLVASPGAGADDRSISLSGGGPATGSLSFAGTGTPEPDARCAGHTVRRIFGPASGRLELRIDGVGAVSVAADGSPTAPQGAYREQID
jgi:hypothetical protein